MGHGPEASWAEGRHLHPALAQPGQKLVMLQAGERKENPQCPECGKKMKSAGIGQGYRCKACKTVSMEKEVSQEKGLEQGIYQTPICARRHLMQPLERGCADLLLPYVQVVFQKRYI